MAVIKQALLSVSDKTGLVEFARGLAGFGVAIGHPMGEVILRTAFMQAAVSQAFSGPVNSLGYRSTPPIPRPPDTVAGVRPVRAG